MYTRGLVTRIDEAMADTPVILLNGARQTGKSTLMQSLVNTSLDGEKSDSDHSQSKRQLRYYTLDDAVTLAAAQRDAAGFIGSQSGSVWIDEIQRAPELFLAIKHAVDQQRSPGRFLLSGSANALLLPRVADSLAGRMEVLTLWPLAQAELQTLDATTGQNLPLPANFIDCLFAPIAQTQNAAPSALDSLHNAQLSREDLHQRLLAGGYPEVLQRPSERRRSAWFDAYLNTVLQRDVRELAQIEGITQLPLIMSHLAHKATGALNMADLSRSLGITQTTLKRYLTLLQTVYMLSLVPAWSPRESHRAQKTPKIFFNDSGLLAHLLGLSRSSLAAQPGLPGTLLETFVFTELSKLLGWANTSAQLMHYRTATGMEVDFVLQDRQQRIVGIEVKSSTQLGSNDFKGLHHLRELIGPQFHRGIVLHPGAQTVAFDSQLAAVPISALWAL